LSVFEFKVKTKFLPLSRNLHRTMQEIFCSALYSTHNTHGLLALNRRHTSAWLNDKTFEILHTALSCCVTTINS